MLKEIIFCLKYEMNLDFGCRVHDASAYIKRNGVKSRVVYPDLEEQTKENLLLSIMENIGEENVGDVLFMVDSEELSQLLMNSGCYVVGIREEFNASESFTGLKYVFSEIDQVDFDSYIKAYQRYAHLPWTILETERLIVRETTVDDVDTFYEIYSDPAITEFMEDLFENPEDEKKYTADYIEKVYGFMGFGVWSVVLKETGKVIGRAGFSIRSGFDQLELGFLIDARYQRQGYAYEVCRSILDYGRDVLQIKEVLAFVKEGNRVSVHLCEKLGFEKCGDARIEENIYGDTYKDGKRVDPSDASFGSYIKMILHM